MRTIISIICILGITFGAIGAWYLSVAKVMVGDCGGKRLDNGIAQGVDVCRDIYVTSPWIWLFVATLGVSVVGLILNVVIKSSKTVR